MTLRRLAKALLLVALVALPAAAQQTVEVKFNLIPADAKVELLNENASWHALGTADQPLVFEVEKKSVFRFSADGYVPVEEPIMRESLLTNKAWPSHGSLELEPDSLLVVVVYYAKKYWWLGFLPFLYLGWRRRELSKDQRLQYLENLQVEAEMSRDEIMGQKLGPYRLTELIGKGGMAVVYLATREDDSEQVPLAVKILSAEDKEQAQGRFQREVKVCQKLIHPNIVALHDWGSQADLLYLVMEYLGGGSLSEVLAKKPAHEELFRLFDEILAGVEFAHKMGIAHRDLKPENIMLTSSGTPKIMDFGLAKGHYLETVTVTGTILGTPSYMSPEQISGEEPSPAMDQYALGVLGFRMFTGRLPFEGADMMSVITKHLIEEPPTPTALNPEVPQELSDIIIRMLAKKPEDRFRDLGTVRAALKLLEGSS